MTKKIIFLLHLPPPVHGSSMVGKWIKESSLINNSFSCYYINLLASKTVSESGKITFNKVIGMVGICIELLKLLIKKRPQLCYLALTTTGAAFYRDVLLVLIMKTFKTQRIYHLHNKGIAKASKNKINRFFYNFVLKNASVILLSEHLYEDIQVFVPREKIFICPNGIPSIASSNVKKNNKEKLPVVLFLSNLIESKGVYVLLEAMAILKQKEIEFKGIFVGGEGDLNSAKFQEKRDALGLADQVEYIGKKYNKEKEDILNQADIFAFPTYYSNESFPLVLLEAMQFSLPIVSTFEGGIPDLIDDGITGFLVEQKNGIELANKLQILIEDSAIRVKMGQKGNEKYKQEFTLNIFEERLFYILNKEVYN